MFLRTTSLVVENNARCVFICFKVYDQQFECIAAVIVVNVGQLRRRNCSSFPVDEVVSFCQISLQED